PLPAPASVTSNFQDRSRIVLNWTAVTGAADYEILRDGVVIANDADRWFTDLNLPAGTTFTYEIRALAADGTPGELSDPITLSTLP
ncbi:MAG: esterase, partial [Acidimicrobiales bacterium]